MGPTVMKSPRSVDMEVTTSCNLRCAYCSHFSGPGDVGMDLPLDAWLRFFSELQRCAVMNVTLSGGEPFYRSDLTEIIRRIVANRMRFSILTNGTLIDPTLASFLESTRRCNHVQVSIDGAAYALTGEVNHPSSDACLRLFQERGGVLPERSAHHQSG